MTDSSINRRGRSYEEKSELPRSDSNGSKIESDKPLLGYVRIVLVLGWDWEFQCRSLSEHPLLNCPVELNGRSLGCPSRNYVVVSVHEIYREQSSTANIWEQHLRRQQTRDPGCTDRSLAHHSFHRSTGMSSISWLSHEYVFSRLSSEDKWERVDRVAFGKSVWSPYWASHGNISIGERQWPWLCRTRKTTDFANGLKNDDNGTKETNMKYGQLKINITEMS